MLSILQDLNAEGRTIILITHDNSIASAARRIVRIQDGRIVEDVPAREPASAGGPAAAPA